MGPVGENEFATNIAELVDCRDPDVCAESYG